MIMSWCNVEIDEYDLQAKTYPTICTHHKLYNNEKIPVFPECICNKWENRRGTQPRKNMMKGKVDTSDLMMILTWAIDISLNHTEMGQLNTHNPIYCNDNER